MSAVRRVAIMIDLQWPVKHHQAIYTGTQRYARERGNWECTVDLYAGEGLHERRGQSEYDGVIARATRQLAVRARRSGVPVVNVWRNAPVKNLPSVFPDPAAAGRMAAEHLMARGLRQFGFLGYRNEGVTRLQMSAFQATVSAAGFPCSTLLVSLDHGESAAAWRKFRGELQQWVDTWPRPIGVGISYDLLARYLAAVCQRKFVRVPDDAALVGNHNELILCLHPEPALSSIEYGFEEIGYRAALLLDQLMDGAPPPKEPLMIPPVELVARQSTDVFAVSDPLVARAMRFMAEHGDQPLRIDDVAAHVHVTRRTLERRFHNSVGRTMAGEITRLRVECVKRQLAETDSPLKVLAARLGFLDDARLCEVFRRVVGMTPGEFRRRCRKLAED